MFSSEKKTRQKEKGFGSAHKLYLLKPRQARIGSDRGFMLLEFRRADIDSDSKKELHDFTLPQLPLFS